MMRIQLQNLLTINVTNWVLKVLHGGSGVKGANGGRGEEDIC